ncbi:GHKL domain-containing protein [Romboutsia weinsteinii]|uniref:GHKL domain-containing protein n=1 Tax=Romboutsia weinsteinii TaxID=2020949 RepID=A0A371J6F3_9FIRM|nr:ATP-binding protein [Romboutsia weinsteinii]RDY28370.1 GHKL domain-containing protein [Romboutsia weinsteinii]
MNFLFDLLNTAIQVSIMTYFPYYFLLTSREIDAKTGKKNLIISGISIFILCILATNIFSNSNLNATSITIGSIIIIGVIYRHIYKKALVAYSIAYILVQIVAILVTSIGWPILSYILYDVEASRLLGIYVPAMILELFIIKNKDDIKVIYTYFTKSRKSLEIGFILVISMDFIVCISMMLNGWSNVALTNIVILMAVIFAVCISVYINNIDKRYKEIDSLNKLLIDKNNELKRIKHDYGSQISYINGLYLMRQYDRLGEILKDIINGNSQVSSNIKYITHEDSVISSVAESLDIGDIHLVIDEEFNSNLIDMSSYELHRILSNILNNAITALNGEGLIVVRTYKIFNSVYISIKNNGPKIDLNIIENIFEEGFTTKDDEDSSHGYGLYIVKEIVENNNGKLSVVSDEKYTEFKIVLFDQNNNILLQKID